MKNPKPSSLKKTRVAVLFGGRSVEHEVSIITAVQMMAALDTSVYELIPVYLDRSGKWWTGEQLIHREFYHALPSSLHHATQVTLLPQPDIKGLTVLGSEKTIPVDICLMAFHGRHGEDGCIQGLLELTGLPYTSCGPRASAVAMDKDLCKRVVQSYGIPVLPWTTVSRHEPQESLKKTRETILKQPGLEKFPLFVKPSHLGSSVGVGIAHDHASLDAALAKVFKYDIEAIIEPCVTNLLEINVSVLEANPPLVSPVEIPVASDGVLTYEDKYCRGAKSKGGAPDGMAGLTRVVNPQDLDLNLKEMVQKYAKEAFRYLECRGVVRFDFLVDLDTDTLYFNELNVLPGSLSYYLWEKADPPLLYTELLNHLVSSALHRRETLQETAVASGRLLK